MIETGFSAVRVAVSSCEAEAGSSVAALDTWPSVQPLGMCGQDGSTTNFGTLTVDAAWGCAAEVSCDPAIKNAATAAEVIVAANCNFRLRLMMWNLLFNNW